MRRGLAGWMAVGVLAIGLAGAPDAQALPSIDLAGWARRGRGKSAE
jgi:hypothetical protein